MQMNGQRLLQCDAMYCGIGIQSINQSQNFALIRPGPQLLFIAIDADLACLNALAAHIVFRSWIVANQNHGETGNNPPAFRSC